MGVRINIQNNFLRCATSALHSYLAGSHTSCGSLGAFHLGSIVVISPGEGPRLVNYSIRMAGKHSGAGNSQGIDRVALSDNASHLVACYQLDGVFFTGFNSSTLGHSLIDVRAGNSNGQVILLGYIAVVGNRNIRRKAAGFPVLRRAECGRIVIHGRIPLALNALKHAVNASVCGAVRGNSTGHSKLAVRISQRSQISQICTFQDGSGTCLARLYTSFGVSSNSFALCVYNSCCNIEGQRHRCGSNRNSPVIGLCTNIGLVLIIGIKGNVNPLVAGPVLGRGIANIAVSAADDKLNRCNYYSCGFRSSGLCGAFLGAFRSGLYAFIGFSFCACVLNVHSHTEIAQGLIAHTQIAGGQDGGFTRTLVYVNRLVSNGFQGLAIMVDYSSIHGNRCAGFGGSQGNFPIVGFPTLIDAVGLAKIDCATEPLVGLIFAGFGILPKDLTGFRGSSHLGSGLAGSSFPRTGSFTFCMHVGHSRDERQHHQHCQEQGKCAFCQVFHCSFILL